MSRLLLVRHGETIANASRIVGGHGDADLTPRGEDQARMLHGRLVGHTFDRVVSSDLRRAVRTAQLGWPYDVPPLESHAALRERHVGEWEGTSIDDLRADGRAATLVTWNEAPPGGESLRMLAHRVVDWFATHDDGSRMLAVVHGGVIRCLVGLIDGLPTDQIGTMRIENTQIEGRDVDPTSWARWRSTLSSGS